MLGAAEAVSWGQLITAETAESESECDPVTYQWPELDQLIPATIVTTPLSTLHVSHLDISTVVQTKWGWGKTIIREDF